MKSIITAPSSKGKWRLDPRSSNLGSSCPAFRILKHDYVNILGYSEVKVTKVVCGLPVVHYIAYFCDGVDILPANVCGNHAEFHLGWNNVSLELAPPAWLEALK